MGGGNRGGWRVGMRAWSEKADNKSEDETSRLACSNKQGPITLLYMYDHEICHFVYGKEYSRSRWL